MWWSGTHFHSMTRCEAGCRCHDGPMWCGDLCELHGSRFVLRLRVLYCRSKTFSSQSGWNISSCGILLIFTYWHVNWWSLRYWASCEQCNKHWRGGERAWFQWMYNPGYFVETSVLNQADCPWTRGITVSHHILGLCWLIKSSPPQCPLSWYNMWKLSVMILCMLSHRRVLVLQQVVAWSTVLLCGCIALRMYPLICLIGAFWTMCASISRRLGVKCTVLRNIWYLFLFILTRTATCQGWQTHVTVCGDILSVALENKASWVVFGIMLLQMFSKSQGQLYCVLVGEAEVVAKVIVLSMKRVWYDWWSLCSCTGWCYHDNLFSGRLQLHGSGSSVSMEGYYPW